MGLLGAAVAAGKSFLSKQEESKAVQETVQAPIEEAEIEGVTETRTQEGETAQEAERRRRRALLSGIKTSSLGIDPALQTVGRARLLG